MAKHDKQPTSTTVESAAIAGLPLVGITAATEALSSYGHINADWIEHMPLADHTSSMLGSYALGAIGGTVTERFAARLESRGRQKSAERVRRVGNTLTAMGSLACQMVA